MSDSSKQGTDTASSLPTLPGAEGMTYMLMCTLYVLTGARVSVCVCSLTYA